MLNLKHFSPAQGFLHFEDVQELLFFCFFKLTTNILKTNLGCSVEENQQRYCLSQGLKTFARQLGS